MTHSQPSPLSPAHCDGCSTPGTWSKKMGFPAHLTPPGLGLWSHQGEQAAGISH